MESWKTPNREDGKTGTSPKQYVCSKCDFTNPSKYNLRQHMKSHTSDSSLSCNKCEFKSQTMNNLTLHNRNEHTDANAVGAGFSSF